MPDILIKNVDQIVLNHLEARSERNKRLLQSEIRLILTKAINFAPLTEAKRLAKLKIRLAAIIIVIMPTLCAWFEREGVID